MARELWLPVMLKISSSWIQVESSQLYDYEGKWMAYVFSKENKAAMVTALLNCANSRTYNGWNCSTKQGWPHSCPWIGLIVQKGEERPASMFVRTLLLPTLSYVWAGRDNSFSGGCPFSHNLTTRTVPDMNSLARPHPCRLVTKPITTLISKN